MGNDGGTPKNLREAIRAATMDPPLEHLKRFNPEDRLSYSIKDFLAQRFGASILLQANLVESALMEIFKDIVEDP